jgi:hypothetical protein
MKKTVLITTATHPPVGMPFLKMTNVATRYITAKAAVFFWAAQGVDEIVISDATGVNLLEEREVQMLSQMNVAIEQISYQQDDSLVTKRGKGYAEGELIKFALDHSSFLAKASHFFKCTGKVYCRNFHAIAKMIEMHQIQSIFWRYLGAGDLIMPGADMRFFYTNKQFCREFLIPAYLSADESKEAIETIFFNEFQKYFPPVDAMRPLISGFAGGTGEQYFDLGLGALDVNYPCWVIV